MQHWHTRHSAPGPRAFSLVEALLATTLLALALTPLLNSGLTMDQQSELCGRRERALVLARAALDNLRDCAFDSLLDATQERTSAADESESSHLGGPPIRVDVVGEAVEDGLIQLTSKATYTSITGLASTVELVTFRVRPDHAARARYPLPEEPTR